MNENSISNPNFGLLCASCHARGPPTLCRVICYHKGNSLYGLLQQILLAFAFGRRCQRFSESGISHSPPFSQQVIR